MSTLIQFSDLPITEFSKSVDLVPIIRPNELTAGYTNYKASLDHIVPDSSSYSLTSSYTQHVDIADSASYSITSSYSISSSNSDTASYALYSELSNTASYSETSSFAHNAMTSSYALYALGIFDTSSGQISSSLFAISASASISSSYSERANCTNQAYLSTTASYASQYLNQPKPIYAYRVWTAGIMRSDLEKVPYPTWNPATQTALDIINSITYVSGSSITPNNMEVQSVPTFRGGIERWSPNTAEGYGYTSYRMYGIRVWIKGGYQVNWRTRWADDYMYVFDGPSWINNSGYNFWGSTSTLLGYAYTNGNISKIYPTDGVHTIFFVYLNTTQEIGCELNEWIDGVNVKFDGIPGIEDNVVEEPTTCCGDINFHTWPVGSVVPFAGSTSSFSGWLECNGVGVLKSIYTDLLDAISNESLTASYGYSCDSTGSRPSNSASYGYFKLPFVSSSSSMISYIRWAGSEQYNTCKKSTTISGDVQGSLSASIVQGIYSRPISASAQTPSDGDVLVYTGSNWTNVPLQNSKTINGYTYLPNGMIMQWGYQQTTTASVYNFPTAFPTACLNFIASNATKQGTRVDNAYGYPVSRTQFYINTKRSDSDALSNYPVYWFATGY